MMAALTIPPTATKAEADAALRTWLHSLAPLAPTTAALLGATLRAGGGAG